jgi:glycosyltransferase involved in cell wall biosynthesis
MSRGLFLSWAPFSRRTETLAQRLGLEGRQVAAPWFKRPLFVPLKYPLQAVRTARLLKRELPAEVWVMDPPAPAVVVAWWHCRRHRVPLVVDMHTVGFYARSWRAVRPLEIPFLRAAAANVVTNRELARRVRGWGCRAYVLPDPLPTPPPDLDDTVEKDTVTIVATFSEDEPIDLLPEVAGALAGLRLFVTGRPRQATSHWPANLVPTGFLDDHDYWRLLRRSQAVVVLTTRPDTLLSGGYEALSLGRPLVVSDHEVLREYYGDAVVYVPSTAAGIAAGIRAAVDDAAELERRLVTLAGRQASAWERDAAALRRDLEASRPAAGASPSS